MVFSSMAHISGSDRSQLLLLPESVDDYVGADNPVRFIEAFVDGLDLNAAGFGRVAPKATGRPGYDPADLLKLYIYGYLNRVRSSRRLEAETQRNIDEITSRSVVIPEEGILHRDGSVFLEVTDEDVQSEAFFEDPLSLQCQGRLLDRCETWPFSHFRVLFSRIRELSRLAHARRGLCEKPPLFGTLSLF